MKLSDTENTIIDAMARAFFVSAWAQKQEERGKSFSGCELMDVAPKTPRYAREFALMFAGQLPSLLVCLNNAAWADVLESHKLEKAHRHIHPELNPEVSDLQTDEYARNFGHYLAMQGMGTGVSWFDDHARFDITIPHTEAYI